MVEANYSYLVNDVLPKLGFNEILDEPLRSAMKLGLEEISLKVIDKQPGGDFQYNVVIEKGKGEMNDPEKERFYFANRVEVTYQMHGESKPRQHTFGLYRQKGFPVNQMRNLMKGNYVHNTFRKDGQEHGRWQYVDFKAVKDDGGHPLKSIWDNNLDWNVSRELSELPLVNQLTREAKEDILRALHNGEEVAAVLKIDKKSEQVALRANPQRMGIEFYDSQGLKIGSNSPKMTVVDDGKHSRNLKEAATLVTDSLGDDIASGKKQRFSRK